MYSTESKEKHIATCRRGHPRTPENIAYYRRGLKTQIVCIPCRNISGAARWKRIRGAKPPGYKGHLGDKNPKWKGDTVGNHALHTWVRRHYAKPELCNCCQDQPPLDLANISQHYNPATYTRNFSNWEWLCRRCHMVKDGRMQKFIEYGKSRRNT